MYRSSTRSCLLNLLSALRPPGSRNVIWAISTPASGSGFNRFFFSCFSRSRCSSNSLSSRSRRCSSSLCCSALRSCSRTWASASLNSRSCWSRMLSKCYNLSCWSAESIYLLEFCGIENACGASNSARFLSKNSMKFPILVSPGIVSSTSGSLALFTLITENIGKEATFSNLAAVRPSFESFITAHTTKF